MSVEAEYRPSQMTKMEKWSRITVTKKSTSDSDTGADDVTVSVHVTVSFEAESAGTIMRPGNACAE